MNKAAMKVYLSVAKYSKTCITVSKGLSILFTLHKKL